MLGDKDEGLEVIEVSPSITTTNLIRGGVVKYGVGKSSKVKSLSFHFTTLGEKGVSKLSPSKPRIGGEKSAGKLPKLKFLETPAICIIGESEPTTRVCK